MLAAVIRSALDVARPTFYAMAIVIAALVPVFALERVEGRIFRPLALTYTFALVGALVFSLTVVPALCALMLRPQRRRRARARVRHLAAGAARAVLGAFLARRRAVLAGALAIVALVGLVATRLGTEFLPELDEGDLVIFVEMPPSISLAEGHDVLVDVRQPLARVSRGDRRAERAGPSRGRHRRRGRQHERDLRPPASARTTGRRASTRTALIETMRASLTEIPGVRFNFSQPIKDNVEEAMSGVRGKVVLKIFGPDLDAMRTTLEHAQAALRPVAGITDLELYRDAAVPQLQIELDREALARSGVEVETRGRHRRDRARRQGGDDDVGGRAAGAARVLPAGGRAHEPRPRSATSQCRRAARGTCRCATSPRSGSRSGRASINREANSRYQALKFNVEGRDLGSGGRGGATRRGGGVQPPPGPLLRVGRRVREPAARDGASARDRARWRCCSCWRCSTARSARRRSAARDPRGGARSRSRAAWPPWHSPAFRCSVSATIGFIALLGQVSLCGLLVLSAIERRRRDGEASRGRRPHGRPRARARGRDGVALALLGLLPMALSTAPGSEIQRPFAVVIVGGMLTTPFVALWSCRSSTPSSRRPSCTRRRSSTKNGRSPLHREGRRAWLSSLVLLSAALATGDEPPAAAPASGTARERHTARRGHPGGRAARAARREPAARRRAAPDRRRRAATS